MSQSSSSNAVKNGRENQTKTRWLWSWKQKVGSFTLFFMILQYFCRFFQSSNSCLQFVFSFLLLSKHTLYVGGSKFEFGINYSKRKLPQYWEQSLVIYFLFQYFLWLSCVMFPSWHQLHLGSLEIYPYCCVPNRREG